MGLTKAQRHNRRRYQLEKARLGILGIRHKWKIEKRRQRAGRKGTNGRLENSTE